MRTSWATTLWIGPPPGRTTAELLPLESWGSPIGVLGRLGGAEEVLGANLRNLPMGVYLGQRDLPEGYLGQKGPVDPSGIEGRWKSEAGGSARCLVDVIMANSCQIPYYELNKPSAFKFVIGI